MTDTQTVVGSVLAGVVLFGAAVRALPAVWSFVRTAAKAPAILEQILHEFAPNSGDSMRDKINTLTDDTAHLRATTHRIDGKLSATVAAQADLIEKVHQHTIDDGAAFADTHEAQTQILEKVDRIEAAVEINRAVAEQVKHDLDQFNELDTLGREKKIDRRQP